MQLHILNSEQQRLCEIASAGIIAALIATCPDKTFIFVEVVVDCWANELGLTLAMQCRYVKKLDQFPRVAIKIM
jgi:hypothetical protein